MVVAAGAESGPAFAGAPMATFCTWGPSVVACEGVIVGYHSATSIFSVGEVSSVCRRKPAKVSAAMTAVAIVAMVATAATASVAIAASAALTLYFIVLSRD